VNAARGTVRVLPGGDPGGHMQGRKGRASSRRADLFGWPGSDGDPSQPIGFIYRIPSP
jgi:hypothetical protein